MTTTGQINVKPPVSPHANLTATARIGTTKAGSAIWQVACSCGITLPAWAPAIKKGTTRCPTCNPRLGADHTNKILAALPGTYAKIVRKTKLTYGQVKYRITVMRKSDLCHVGDWSRVEWQGAFGPIFHAGAGEDVPCTLKRRTSANTERRYQKRVQKAIKTAVAGGKEDGRYTRHISLHIADKTARKTRTEPHGWAAALFVGVKVEQVKESRNG